MNLRRRNGRVQDQARKDRMAEILLDQIQQLGRRFTRLDVDRDSIVRPGCADLHLIVWCVVTVLSAGADRSADEDAVLH